MRRVGVAGFKDQLSRYLRAAEGGEVIEITDRDRPIVRLVPVRGEPTIPIRPARTSFSHVRHRTYANADWAIDSTRLLAEERLAR